MNDTFYKHLTCYNTSLINLLSNEEHFTTVPEDWHIVVADIENSTHAVANGYHNDVNLSATGSIIAVLNELKLKNAHDIPYFFGGDGATFIVPSNMLDAILNILYLHKNHVFKTFSLSLRVGSMAVKNITAANFKLLIAKNKLNSLLTIPVIIGNGLNYAEKTIKEKLKSNNNSSALKRKINLDGMQCRWDEIPPLKNNDKVICLLINATNDALQSKIYADVLKTIELIFGVFEKRKPIVSSRLKLTPALEKLKKEMYARLGGYNVIYLIKNWILTNIGVYYFKYFDRGKTYLDQVSELSESIMIDGNINTIIVGDGEKIAKLKTYLKTQEYEGNLTFGIHVTYASVMSCYVQDMTSNHIHFVDATEGGYTTAAKTFKEKMMR